MIPVYCIRSGDQHRIIFDSTPRIGEHEVAHTEIDVEKFIQYCMSKGYLQEDV